MTPDAEELKWQRLSAERAELRTAMLGSLRALDDRVADPLGLKDVVRRHPYVAAGGAAAAGAVLVNLLVSSGPSSQRESDREEGRRTQSNVAAALIAPLRDAAVRVLTPWLLDFVQERFLNGAASGVEETPTAPAA